MVLVLGSLPQFSIVSDHDRSPFFECRSCSMIFSNISNNSNISNVSNVSNTSNISNSTIAEELELITRPDPPLDIPDVEQITRPDPILDIPDVICAIWFTIEYLLRLWAAPNSWRFVRRPFAIIDLLAIVPFYAEYGFRALCICEYKIQGYSKSLVLIRILRLFRLLRVLRVLKLARYSLGVQVKSWPEFKSFKFCLKFEISLKFVWVLKLAQV